MGVRTDTRQRMVTSAALLLREHGVAGTSIAKVLDDSGGPRGSVGFHFPGGRAELLAEALRWAGGHVTLTLRRAGDAGTSPATVFAGICEHYRAQLLDTGFAAGCPVGAAAQEAPADPALGPVVAAIVDEWTTAFTGILVAAGHEPARAADLATLCIGSLEGAITMARVQRTTRPIDITLESLRPLLAAVDVPASRRS